MPKSLLSPTQNKIFQAHLSAYKKHYQNEPVEWFAPTTKEELVAGLREGKVCKKLWDEISFHYVSMTSSLMSATLGHISNTMERDMKKGFSIVLTNLQIL